MVDQLVDDATPAAPRPMRRRRSIAALVVVIVLAAAVTGVKAVFHYTHAAALSCACGLVWSRADNRTLHETQAGSYSAMNVDSRAPQRQTFYVEIVNRSSVTQTFLGLGHDDSETVNRGVLAISRVDDSASDMTDEQLSYTTRPVDIPPNGQYTLRYTFTAGCMPARGSMSFQGIDVTVRTGWFTRVEWIDFGSTFFVVRGTPASEGRMRTDC